MFKSIKIALLGAIGMVFAASAYAEITFVSWGGAYTMSQQKAYIDTWGGGSVTVENYNGGLGEIQAQVEAGNVTWDVVDVLPDQAITGCDNGLFEELPFNKFKAAPDGTSMLDDMVAGPVSDCAAPQIFWSYVAFYDPANFSEKPTSIADFFDTEKFPGKRGIHTWANALIEMALVADGVAPGDVYGVMDSQGGIDRAFSVLDRIKDDVVFWSAGSQPLELMSAGEVTMALAYNGRVGAAILSEGKSFEYLWDGQVLEQEYIVMIKGTKNYDEALDFMIHASAAEQLAGQAAWIPYGPMRASSIGIISDNEPFFNTGVNIMPHMPNTPERLERSVIADPFWWADNGAEVNEMYSALMGS